MMPTLMPALLVTLLALQGCATRPGPGGAAAGASTAPAAPGEAVATARAQPLVTERRWLQSWFKGTPVQIEQRGDGPVEVEVPREFCFDAGRSQIKPALGAVLDKVAQSLRRTPQARLQWVAAPGDVSGPAPLALQRATQVRAHLLSRGVPATQMAAPSTSSAATVQLRLELAAL